MLENIKLDLIKNFKFTKETAHNLTNRYKEGAVKLVKEKSYLLYNFDIELNDIRSIIEKYSTDHEADLYKAIIFTEISDEVKKRGNVFVYKKELISRVEHQLHKDFNLMKFDKGLNELINDNEITIDETSEGNDWIYISKLYNAELELAENIKYIVNRKKEKIDLGKLDIFIAEYAELKLDKEQKEAIKVALSNNISIITGEAGTGKTAVIKGIIEALKCENPFVNIQMLAYTGKAAQKLTETTQVKSKTIHSYLVINDEKISRGKFLKTDVVIVDEASMIDLELMNILVKASKESKVVLVGDYRQLRPIDAGFPFLDFINSGLIKMIELKKIYRQKHEDLISINANKILNGIGLLEDKSGIKLKKNTFEFIEYNSSEEIWEKIRDTIEKLIDSGSSLYDIQVISSFRKGKNGTDDLNEKIAWEFNKMSVGDRNKFSILDNVIITRNNHKKEIFNGQKGIVIRVETDAAREIEFMNIKFKDKVIGFRGSEIDDVGLAYALTAHKLQGSDSPIVIIVVEKEHINMLSKELLYVAVTRATERVMLIGDKEIFNQAVKKERKLINSLLVDRLC